MYALIVIVLVAIAVTVSGQAVGGWFPVDITLSQVQEAAVFAVNHKYPNENPAINVVSAMKQVRIFFPVYSHFIIILTI